MTHICTLLFSAINDINMMAVQTSGVAATLVILNVRPKVLYGNRYFEKYVTFVKAYFL
jgi:hypothetical protein